MTVISSAQLTRLRQRPHRTKAYLAIYEPGTVLAAQIDHAGISKGENEVNISIISGAVASVKEGMTVYIGTTPGGRDKGRLRIRACDASTMTLAENALDWIDGWYLTVVKFFEPWAVFPRIVLDSNNVPIFYKDYDIAYDNQNRYMDPVVHMGPHHAGFLVTGAHGVHYSASGTFDPTDDSIPTGYQWAFEGGSPSGSMVKDPGYVQYTATGHYLTELTVVSNSGQSFTGYRHVMIYDRPDDGPNRPIVKFGFRSFEGSRDDGGYSISFFVRERADFTKVREGALVVVFTEQWQGGERVSVGGNAENRSDILFVGYIENESITLNAITSNLEFRASSVSRIMGYLSTYSASLESKISPSTWNELYDMTVDKAVIHFLRWQSTVLKIADFSKTEDTKRVQYADFNRGDLYSAVNDFYNGTLLASMVSDRQGKLWSEIDVNMLATGSTRALATAMTLTRQDWRNEISIQRPTHDELAYIEMGGIAYSGPTTGTFDAYLAGAPGDVAGYFGGVQRQQGLVLTGQTQLNRLVGLAFARANPEYSQVNVPLAGDYRNLDIAPQERLLINLEADENYRGIVWDSKPFIPSVMTLDLRASDQALLMDARLIEETHGSPGTSIDIPVDPPWDTGDLPDWDIEFPPLPSLPPLPLPTEPPPAEGNIVYAVYDDGQIARTRNFWESPPTWEALALPVSPSAFYPHPTDPANQAYFIGAGFSKLYKTNNLNDASPTWTLIFDATDSANFADIYFPTNPPTHIHPDQIKLWDLALWKQQPGYVWLLCYFQNGWGGRSAIIYSTDDFGSWDDWNVAKNPTMGLPNDGSHEHQIVASSHGNAVVYVIPGGGGGGQGLYRSVNFGAQFTKIYTRPANYYYPFVMESPFPNNDGDQVIWFYGGDQGDDPHIYYSADGGASHVSRSPYWDGSSWCPTYLNGDIPSQLQDALMAHPRNGRVYGWLKKDGSDTHRFAFYTEGAGWTPLADRYAVNLNIYPSAANPTDSLKWYALSNENGKFIIGSSDGGYTWLNKQGNLTTVLGGLPAGRVSVFTAWNL